MGTILTIASGKGGTGKSALACLLGAALQARGRRVALVDANTGLRCLDLWLGMQDRVVYDLCDLAREDCRLSQALVKDRAREGLSLLPAAQGEGAGTVAPERMAAIARQLAGLYDYVLVDCPSGVGPDFLAAAHAGGRALLAVQDDPVCLRGAERTEELLRSAGAQDVRLVLNRALILRGEDIRIRARAIADSLSLPLLGIVPEDARLIRAALPGEGEALDAARRIAARLDGEGTEIPPLHRARRLTRVRRPAQ